MPEILLLLTRFRQIHLPNQCRPPHIIEHHDDHEGEDDRERGLDQFAQRSSEVIAGEREAHVRRGDLHGRVNEAHEQAEQRQSRSWDRGEGDWYHRGGDGQGAGDHSTDEAEQREDQKGRDRDIFKEFWKFG